MDPNVALGTLRARLADIRGMNLRDEVGLAADVMNDVADAIEALDKRLSNGGSLPAAWVTEPTYVSNVGVKAVVGVNNVEDHMVVTLGGTTVKLDLHRAAFLYKGLGERLDMRPVGFIDTGYRI